MVESREDPVLYVIHNVRMCTMALYYGFRNSILLESMIESLVSTSSCSFTESSTPDGGDSCQPLGHRRRLLRARESAVRESQETRTAKGGAGQHQ